MKKILLVSPFPPKLGGVSVSSERLFENLVDDGYEVYRYNIRYKKNRYNKPFFLAVRYFLLPFYIIFHPQVDIIHFHVPGVLRKLYPILFKPFYKSAKVVFTIHGDITTLIKYPLVKWVLSKSDKIICVQKGDSAKLPPNLSAKAIDNSAFILPNKIGLDGLPQKVLDFVKRNDSKLLIFYGSVILDSDFYDLYGIKDIVDLYNNLVADQVSFRLLAFINYNESSIKECDFLKEQLGKVIKKDNFLSIKNNMTSILGLYQYANIYIRPTKTDGDSLAVREALALGCTVIASNKAVRPDGVIVFSDENDMLIKVRNSILSENKREKKIDNPFYSKIVELYESIC